jgi:septum formation protein
MVLVKATQSNLVLASASPRRHELLGAAGIEFEVRHADIDETRASGESAEAFASRMAREKALAVSARMSGRLILGADTIVECAGEIFGKPRDESDARRMLHALSGRVHVVITAFALARDALVLEEGAVISRVRFRALSDAEIDLYVLSGEPMDKAGAYGIQGQGGGFIADVAGSRDNVMGLPMAEVLAALSRHGIIRGRPENRAN